MFEPATQGFALLMTEMKIPQKVEVLLYPFESLLAEFGGALGLFIGFSFLTIYDVLKKTVVRVQYLVNKRY